MLSHRLDILTVLVWERVARMAGAAVSLVWVGSLSQLLVVALDLVLIGLAAQVLCEAPCASWWPVKSMRLLLAWQRLGYRTRRLMVDVVAIECYALRCNGTTKATVAVTDMLVGCDCLY